MRDAVSLIGKSLQIKEVKYTISSVNFVPVTNKLYIGLTKSDGITVNYHTQTYCRFLLNKLSYERNCRSIQRDSITNTPW
jgi:hypothetical protein